MRLVVYADSMTMPLMTVHPCDSRHPTGACLLSTGTAGRCGSRVGDRVVELRQGGPPHKPDSAGAAAAGPPTEAARQRGLQTGVLTCRKTVAIQFVCFGLSRLGSVQCLQVVCAYDCPHPLQFKCKITDASSNLTLTSPTRCRMLQQSVP